MTDVMRIATGQFREPTDDLLQFAAQMGVSGVVLNTPNLPGDTHWEFMDLLHLRTRCEAYGLRLESIENVPNHFYHEAMLGLPGRDEQIASYQTTIRHMGEAGIPILGYHWMPSGVWRTSRHTLGRGGARVTSFDLTPAARAPLSDGRAFSEDEMWANYEYFMHAVLPVAEQAGVKLALHPDDPPVESLGGVARIMRSFEGFKRALKVADSPNHGLDFCMGCWSEMGRDVIEPLRYFASRGKIFYVHFRDVQGEVPEFRECFLGEGNVDVVQAMRTLHECGFTGFLIDDHVPHMLDDTSWGHRGRALATGQMLGLLAAVRATG
jgi:mannonate dehydratase